MQSVNCPRCGLINWAHDEECKRCHSSLAKAQAREDRVVETYSAPAAAAYAPQGPASPKSGMAIASMVLGILGCIPPLGLVLGIVAYRNAKNKPLEYGGHGFAIAGIILNAIGILLIPVFILMVAATAVPNLIAARSAANEASAISSLRTISSAEATWIQTWGNGKCGELADLGREGLIKKELASGTYNGYRFEVVFSREKGRLCDVYATPESTAAGSRSFLFSGDGDLHGADKKGRKAEMSDPVLNRDSDRPYSNDSRYSNDDLSSDEFSVRR